MEQKQWEGHVIDGRYLLRQYLGGSAHSAVFLTEYGETNPRPAAIKLVAADSYRASTWMLRRELAARLSHPGLLPIFEFGTCRVDNTDLVYIVMEQTDDDLSQLVPFRPLDAGEARDMLTTVVDTLAYVHAEGFVHGCLTPNNVMAVGDRIKISSDGLLRIGESSDDLWTPNPNGPPEARAGMTPAGDVWCLGMMLVEVLTQQAPAWDRTRTGDPPVPGTLPAPFLDIARRCLRWDARVRCSLEEISLALQPAAPARQVRPQVAVAAAAAPVPRPVPIPLPIAKPLDPALSKRKYRLPVAVAALGGLILSGAILTRVRSAGSSPAETAPQSAVSPGTPPVAAKPEHKPTPLVGEVPPGDDVKPSAAAAPPSASVESAPSADRSAASLTDGEVIDRVLPEIPPEILQTVRGKMRVSVRVTVDESGAVVDAELESHPGSKYFDRKALDAARRWKFKPGEAQSTRVVRFEFRKDGCEAL